YVVGTQSFTGNLVITIQNTDSGLVLTDNVNSIDITGSVHGGSGPNQFNFANDALVTGALVGGPGANTFTFHDTAWVAGLVDGGADDPSNAPDVVDFSQATGPVTISPSQFVNIEEFIGNGTTATLLGPDSPNTWIITGLNSGTLNGIPSSNV